MLLKNRKTGAIGVLHYEPDKEYHFTVVPEDPAEIQIHKDLSSLYGDWEDYKEPEKEYYSIYYDGSISKFSGGAGEDIEDMKSIGNFFKTEEEAEEAVEKLKAYKRLKDKGFRWRLSGGCRAIDFSCPDECYNNKDFWTDMETLFGRAGKG